MVGLWTEPIFYLTPEAVPFPTIPWRLPHIRIFRIYSEIQKTSDFSLVSENPKGNLLT